MSSPYVLGIDPGKKSFAVSLLDADGARVCATAEFACDRGGFDGLEAMLRHHVARGSKLVAGVEATGSLDCNLLAWLRGRESTTVLRLDPGQVAGFRTARPRRGKTDRSDAHQAALFTRTYAGQIACFEHDPQTQAMARLINERVSLVAQRTAEKNRLHDKLVITFPELTRVVADPACALGLELLGRFGTARHMAAAKWGELAMIAPPGPRSAALGEKRARKLVELAQHSVASATDDFDAQTVGFMVGLIRMLDERIGQIAKNIADFVKSDPIATAKRQDAQTSAARAATKPSIAQQIALADTIKGIGLDGAATIVLRAGGITRFTSGKALAAQLGACPERHQTGTSLDITRLTRRGDRRTRALLYMTTLSACTCDTAMKFHKWRLQKKGLTAKQALCACMNRMAHVIHAVVTSATPYDPAMQILAAKKQHPQLWAEFQQTKTPKPKPGQQAEEAKS